MKTNITLVKILLLKSFTLQLNSDLKKLNKLTQRLNYLLVKPALAN